MKNSIFIITMFLMFTFFSLNAQKNIVISGKVSDKTSHEGIYPASISLLNSKTNKAVNGAMSDTSGVFKMPDVSAGSYTLQISYLGYKTIEKPLTINGSVLNFNVGNFEMDEDGLLLQEAVIEGKAPEIVVKNDTVEYNATSYKTPENSVVEDLLKKLPGMEVDKDGKITYNGKEVKKFLVEGKEFFSDDPKVASKNLPAQMVDKLQVVDRKSDMSRMTGFDDGQEETTINITLQPGMKQGTMGNAMIGAGRDLEADKDTRLEGSAMVNHMKNNDRSTFLINANNTNNMGASDLGGQQFGGMRGMRRGAGGILESENFAVNLNKEFSPKLSLNGDISYNSSDRNSSSDVQQTTLAGDKSQLDKTLTKNDDISDNFNARFRMEWKPDTNNTFVFRPTFSANSSSSDQTQLFSRFNYNTLDTLFDGHSQSYNQGKGYNVGASLEYSHRFSKPGRVLSLSARGSYNDSYSYGNSDWLRHDFQNGVYAKDSIRNQHTENDNNTSNFRIYASFVEPLGHNNFLQFAYQITQYDTKSINSTYSLYDLPNYASGDSAVLVGDQSRSTVRNSTEQRFSLNFKSVREKYNYTIGVNIDPTRSNNKTLQPYNTDLTSMLMPPSYDERFPNVEGDSTISNIPLSVINFSPIINFNYLFGKRTNLRIDYTGVTNQPTADQLRDYTDISNPMNQTRGNPNLKPGYTNQLSARFNKFIPESQMFYNFNLNGNMSFNDITSVTTINEDNSRLTTYQNINGNWNVRLFGMFSTPLKNKKFVVSNFTMASYANTKSYSDDVETTGRNLMITDRPNIKYQTKLFDVNLNGNISYNKITYDGYSEDDMMNDQELLNWGLGGSTTWYLPHNFTIDTDISWTKRSGYTTGFNISETLWNASLTKQLFNKKFGVGSLRLKIYDILQDRNTISGTSDVNGFRYTKSTNIPSFFMASFIYKFSIFPKGSAASETDLQSGGRGEWRGGQGGGGGGGRPGSSGGGGGF